MRQFKHGIRFNASSPDEAALVSAAADFGYVFTARSPTTLTIKVNGANRVIELLDVIEFTLERKRSSLLFVILKMGKLSFYVKVQMI